MNEPDYALEMQRVRAQTHTFQNVRPFHPEVAAICARCGLSLPQGGILSIGPWGLPPCDRSLEP